MTPSPTSTPFRNVIIQNNNSNGVDVASYASNFSQVFNFSFPIVYGETVNGFHYEIFSGDFITFGVTGGTEYVLNIFRNDELIDTISNPSPYFYVYSFNTGFTENDLLKLVLELIHKYYQLQQILKLKHLRQQKHLLIHQLLR
jgi:hypothetical protein